MFLKACIKRRLGFNVRCHGRCLDGYTFAMEYDLRRVNYLEFIVAKLGWATAFSDSSSLLSKKKTRLFVIHCCLLPKRLRFYVGRTCKGATTWRQVIYCLQAFFIWGWNWIARIPSLLRIRRKPDRRYRSWRIEAIGWHFYTSRFVRLREKITRGEDRLEWPAKEFALFVFYARGQGKEIREKYPSSKMMCRNRGLGILKFSRQPKLRTTVARFECLR